MGDAEAIMLDSRLEKLEALIAKVAVVADRQCALQERLDESIQRQGTYEERIRALELSIAVLGTKVNPLWEGALKWGGIGILVLLLGANTALQLFG